MRGDASRNTREWVREVAHGGRRGRGELVLTVCSQLVDAKLKCYNMDARAFARELIDTRPPPPLTHIIMNLPASAVEFLGMSSSRISIKEKKKKRNKRKR